MLASSSIVHSNITPYFESILITYQVLLAIKIIMSALPSYISTVPRKEVQYEPDGSVPPIGLIKAKSEPNANSQGRLLFLLHLNSVQADGEKYKKYVDRFESGTPEELLMTLKSMEEI